MLDEEIFCYIGIRVDNDNILPCEDDIYTAFQHHFEIGGHKTEIIEKVMKSYCNISDLTGVQIKYEGEIA